MTRVALHDQLYTTIHTNVQCFKGVDFSDKFLGKFEQVGGSGSYDGTFRGTRSDQNTKAIFAYKVGGVWKSIGFNVKYRGNMSGNWPYVRSVSRLAPDTPTPEAVHSLESG